MTDQLIAFGDSAVQHGKHSDRIYLMHLAEADFPEILVFLDCLAAARDYSKIFVKVPAWGRTRFLKHGYHVEATVPNLHQGKLDVCFMGKYRCPTRQQEQEPELVRQALAAATGKSSVSAARPPLPEPLHSRPTTPDDAGDMAALYRRVFATYPFPIHDPDYLCQTMASHVIYHGIWNDRELVALASAETDRHGQNAEMTDFATLPNWQGQGLASYLLAQLEDEAASCGLRTAYTIARAYSFGMNVTFAKQGYRFSGTLTHNTQISGKLESMNVWHKTLQPEGAA